MVRPKSPRERRGERGFTLVELMVVVVIIAILAAVVVPSFLGEAKKVRSKSEVSPMMAELSTKEERYKNESNAYLAVAECPTPADNTDKSVTTCQGVGSPWLSLGIQPPEQNLRCSYEVIVGTSADDPSTMIPAGATYSVPTGCCATSWYMVHAKCDADGNGTFSHYMTASFDATMQITNEGH